MNNNLHQMSDRSQHCPLFAVHDLHQNQRCHRLTLSLLTTTIVAPPSNASKWQMGFNSAFKGLKSDYPEAVVQTTLPFVGQASLQMENMDISLSVWIWR